jgi:hypothetical protein
MSGEYKNIVGYSPSDFFYVSALDYSRNLNIDCANIDFDNLNANTIGNITNGNRVGNIIGSVDGSAVIQVYKKVCKNRDLVNSWTHQKINHSGSEQVLNDSQTAFNATLLNTVNLVVGIGFLTWSLTSGWMYR